MTMNTSGVPVRLAAVGDIMMARDVGRHYADSPADFAMHDIRNLLSGVDLVCANLENPVAIGGRPDPVQDPHVTFRATPQTLDALKAIGVHVVSLGNNHMLDYGEAALAETLEHLDAAGIKRVGAGRNYQEANTPLLVDCKGRRLAFLSYAFIYSANTRMATRYRAGVSDHRLHRILPVIRELSAAGCDVVVTIHWGFEYCFFPLPYQMRQARRMIEAGACLILGHGPHYPQGIEEHRGRDIVYSLGNFIFDEPHKFANRSFIYGAEIGGTGSARRRVIVPVHLRRHVPHLVAGAEKRRLEGLIANLAVRYRGADQGFWKDLSASYLTDICGRVVRSRSLKYLRVPPLSFYRDAGPAAIIRKLRPSTIIGVARSLGMK
jgi:poly-gamma-glutamate capsule biosynthesis protein CapA/YwtB (metallophosphatase superfamily)